MAHHGFFPVSVVAPDSTEQTSSLGSAHHLRALSCPKLCPLNTGSPHQMAGQWGIQGSVCLPQFRITLQGHPSSRASHKLPLNLLLQWQFSIYPLLLPYLLRDVTFRAVLTRSPTCHPSIHCISTPLPIPRFFPGK